MNNNDNQDTSKEHYDGIRELDNNLPNWWLVVFIVTIIYSIGYMAYYHMEGGGTLPVQEYLEEQKKIAQEKIKSTPSSNSSITEEDLSAVLGLQKEIEAGRQIYDSKCLACHAPGGAGSVGPNLTDDYWLHGGKPLNIVTSISKGIPDKGMIAWESLLQKKEIMSLVAFIKSIGGSNPLNAKAPQGVKEEP